MSHCLKNCRLHTKIIHCGSHPDPHTGSLSVPIYQTSTFVFESAEQGGRRFAGEEEGYIYTRMGNPNHVVIEEKLAIMEGGEASVCFSSGMGAISATLLTMLKQGDHIVASRTLYGCTFSLMSHGLPRFGINTTFVNASKPEEVRKAIRPETKIFFFESPANPTLDVYDIKSLSDLAHEYDLQVVFDNTFCTPYLQQPLKLGADVVVHSATKYLNGHGDVIAGFAVGSKELMARVRGEGLKDYTGAVLGPFESYLIMRGMKTLPIRMDRHCANAQVIAEYLQRHPKVERIAFPGLPTDPGYDIAKKQMLKPGALITFDVKGGFEAAKRVINNVEICALAVSLGDIESLIQHPASMTHSAYNKEELAEAGIREGMVRLSVGLEDPEDICADLDKAFSKI
ncbi:MAG TPA: methionine gamma-lyase [Thermoanaerobaculia bacterium]|nr:methionine gamma-lyase [Thermoanaerobaculia bacterium]HUM30089.1 methionine gamma-lyase [Thermoanaerobaculia bacterium]HXK68786.1 methionine gamma-lyase [Thermoanaerobaculia bacterium]